MSKKIDISSDFHLFSLLRFALPSTVMMVFMSLYTIVDGVFISRLVGAGALSATNIVYPAVNLVIAVGVMLATGGNAIVARRLGEGDPAQARESFSLLVAAGLLAGLAFCVAGNLFWEPIVRMLGATEALYADCAAYLRILMLFAPACVLQLLFQTFFVTAGRPGVGLLLTIGGGVVNMLLDYLLMGPLQMGIAGAAVATGAGQLLPTLVGLGYFAWSKGELRLVRPHFDAHTLLHSCLNGSSEMVTNLSSAVVTFLFNVIMLRLLGEDGVAAITIVLYGQFLFTALYLGFCMGVAPVFSYHYGAQNHAMLQRLFRICTGFVAISSAAITALALLLAAPIVAVFSPVGSEIYALARHGFLLFSLNYLFAGMNIFASSMFTAFSDGRTSAIISFVRTFGLLVVLILLLPYLMGVDGVWLAVPAAEFATVFLAGYYFRRKRERYHYLPAR